MSFPFQGRADFQTGGVAHAAPFEGVVKLGVTGGWARATARAGEDSRLRGSGFDYGAFVEFGGWEGLFGRALVKRDDYKLRYSNGLLGLEDRVRGHSTGFDGAIGFRTPMMGAMADILAGVSHVKSKTREFDVGFINFRGKSTSTRGRIAGRLQWNGSIAPYVGATLFHEFSDNTSVRAISGLLEDGIDLRRPRHLGPDRGRHRRQRTPGADPRFVGRLRRHEGLGRPRRLPVRARTDDGCARAGDDAAAAAARGTAAARDPDLPRRFGDPGNRYLPGTAAPASAAASGAGTRSVIG